MNAQISAIVAEWLEVSGANSAAWMQQLSHHG
jgi:hypothetical protein